MQQELSLSAEEKNYAQIEQEALVLIYGVQKSHQYLYAHKFTLLTDHKPLTSVQSPKVEIPTLVTARMQRWALTLLAYH